ncbi:RelA/SpoT domain-containing protein [Vulcaniibacterium tengchongense]|nr:RelA/SpoT domain-containing protein [Vulcaniibacterium tengchongense]
MQLEDFLTANRIEQATWERARISWEELQAIAADHEHQRQPLIESATLYANLIQKIPGVHSVRWRIKDTGHLLEKIVRKRAAEEEKYASVDRSNYYTVVTDLIGIRALHLFKDDCFDIHKSLTADWTPLEPPVAYIRNGDPDELTEKYRNHDLEVKIHPAGYRSVHYVFGSQPLNRRVVAEVQIRTIFEEGWSEIDHTVRYPNFSDNELVGYFLTIFNRLAGSADEMGTFVRGLAAAIQGYQLQISQASAERDESLRSMEESLEELARLKQQDKDSQQTIRKLREQVEKMKREKSLDYLFSSPSTTERLHKMLYESSSDKLLKDIQSAENTLKHLSDPAGTSALAKLIAKWPPEKP